MINKFGFFEFSPGMPTAVKPLPGFRYTVRGNWQAPAFPQVNVPFGLDLSDSCMDDNGLKELKGLKNLTALDLHSTLVTDAGLRELKGFKNLKSLSLNFTQLRGPGLKELKELDNLTALDIGNIHGPDIDLRELKVFKNLTTLCLCNTGCGNEDLRELKGLKNLTTLYLTSTRVTDWGMKELEGFKNLKILELTGTQVTPQPDGTPESPAGMQDQLLANRHMRLRNSMPFRPASVIKCSQSCSQCDELWRTPTNGESRFPWKIRHRRTLANGTRAT